MGSKGGGGGGGSFTQPSPMTTQQNTQQGTNQQQTYTPNPLTQAAIQQALYQGQQAAWAPFSMPQAPVAGFTPMQQQYFGQLQGMQGMTNPYFAQAQNYLNQGAGGIGTGQGMVNQGFGTIQQGLPNIQGAGTPVQAGDINRYLNPYADATLAAMKKYVFDPQRTQTMGEQTQMAGGVGADRLALASQNLDKTQADAIAQAQAGFWQPAMGMAEQQKQMQLQSGFGYGALGQGMGGLGQGYGQMGLGLGGLGVQYGGLGSAAQQAALQATGALGQAGTQQQQLAQAQMMAPYNQQLARIAYPFQTAQFMAGLAGGLAPALGGTTTGTGLTAGQGFGTQMPSQPSGLAQTLGIGTGILGGLGAMGAFDNLGGGLNAGTLGGTGFSPLDLTGSAGAIFQRGGGVSDDASSDDTSGDQGADINISTGDAQKVDIPDIKLPQGGSGQPTGGRLDLDPHVQWPLPWSQQQYKQSGSGSGGKGGGSGIGTAISLGMQALPLLMAASGGRIPRQGGGGTTGTTWDPAILAQKGLTAEQMGGMPSQSQLQPSSGQSFPTVSNAKYSYIGEGPGQWGQTPGLIPGGYYIYRNQANDPSIAKNFSSQQAWLDVGGSQSAWDQAFGASPAAQAPAATQQAQAQPFQMPVPGQGPNPFIHPELFSALTGGPGSFAPPQIGMPQLGGQQPQQTMPFLRSAGGSVSPFDYGMPFQAGGPPPATVPSDPDEDDNGNGDADDDDNGYQDGGDVWDTGDTPLPEVEPGTDPYGVGNPALYGDYPGQPHLGMGDIESAARAKGSSLLDTFGAPNQASPMNVQRWMPQSAQILGGPRSAEATPAAYVPQFKAPQQTGLMPGARPMGAPTREGDQMGTILDRAMPVTRHMESTNNYGNVTTTRNRQGQEQRALGAYGIMNFELPELSKKYFGQPISEKEFLSNPPLQDAIYRNEMGRLIQAHGVEGAGRAWLGGEGNINRPNARDPLGTSVGDYGRRFAQGVAGGRYVDEPTQTASAASGMPDPSRYMMPRSQMPFPQATTDNFARRVTSSPWMALMKAGATMAGTVGPIGSVIGAGMRAGAGELEGQRKALDSEEAINQKAAGLYEHAMAQLDRYNQMTPYQSKRLEQTQTRIGQAADRAQATKDKAYADARTRAMKELSIKYPAGNIPEDEIQSTIHKYIPGAEGEDAHTITQSGAAGDPIQKVPPKDQLKPGLYYKLPNGTTRMWDGKGFVEPASAPVS